MHRVIKESPDHFRNTNSQGKRVDIFHSSGEACAFIVTPSFVVWCRNNDPIHFDLVETLRKAYNAQPQWKNLSYVKGEFLNPDSNRNIMFEGDFSKYKKFLEDFEQKGRNAVYKYARSVGEEALVGRAWTSMRVSSYWNGVSSLKQSDVISLTNFIKNKLHIPPNTMAYEFAETATINNYYSNNAEFMSYTLKELTEKVANQKAPPKEETQLNLPEIIHTVAPELKGNLLKAMGYKPKLNPIPLQQRFAMGQESVVPANFDNFINSIINEDAIDTLEFKGNWDDKAKPYGYDKTSIGILKSPKGVEKIKSLWTKFDYPVDMYFVRSKEGNKYTELGKVTPYFVRDNLKLAIPFDSEKITILFTNNKGVEKIPMTAWALAHRFGHALARDYTTHKRNHMYKELDNTLLKLAEDIAQFVYGRNIKLDFGDYGRGIANKKEKIRHEICHALGTFKSARDKNLRAPFEFTNETIAQFIITNKIKFNKTFPRNLGATYAWGKPQGPYSKTITPELQEDINDIIEKAENDVYKDCMALMGASIGDIYLM